jgi:hypothetical protein
MSVANEFRNKLRYFEPPASGGLQDSDEEDGDDANCDSNLFNITSSSVAVPVSSSISVDSGSITSIPIAQVPTASALVDPVAIAPIPINSSPIALVPVVPFPVTPIPAVSIPGPVTPIATMPVACLPAPSSDQDNRHGITKPDAITPQHAPTSAAATGMDFLATVPSQVYQSLGHMTNFSSEVSQVSATENENDMQMSLPLLSSPSNIGIATHSLLPEERWDGHDVSVSSYSDRRSIITADEEERFWGSLPQDANGYIDFARLTEDQQATAISLISSDAGTHSSVDNTQPCQDLTLGYQPHATSTPRFATSNDQHVPGNGYSYSHDTITSQSNALPPNLSFESFLSAPSMPSGLAGASHVGQISLDHPPSTDYLPYAHSDDTWNSNSTHSTGSLNPGYNEQLFVRLSAHLPDAEGRDAFYAKDSNPTLPIKTTTTSNTYLAHPIPSEGALLSNGMTLPTCVLPVVPLEPQHKEAAVTLDISQLERGRQPDELIDAFEAIMRLRADVPDCLQDVWARLLMVWLRIEEKSGWPTTAVSGSLAFDLKALHSHAHS